MQVHPSQPQHSKPDGSLEYEQSSQLDIFQMLSSILVTIAKSEQIMQCMREVLVSDPTFSPMTLFKYLGKGATQLSRGNIIGFLDENSLVSSDRETDDVLKRVFAKYGISTANGIQYTSYLNFIYPYNSGVLRDLLTNKVKKYQELDRIYKNSRPSDSVITAFLLLMEEEIKTEKRIEVQLNDSRFPGRDKLKKTIKSIKKASQKTTSIVTENSEKFISMLELRNFIKAFIQVDDNLFLDLGRRLGLNKSGQIPIQNLENALKKIRKTVGNADLNNDSKQNIEITNESQRPRAQSKQAFKQELYKELATTLQLNPNSKTRTPRAKSANRSVEQPYRNKTPAKRNLQPFNNDLLGLDGSLAEIENAVKMHHEKPYREAPAYKAPTYPYTKPQYQAQSNHRPAQNLAVVTFFKQFIEIFLKGHKEIQKCKSKLCSLGNIDYLSLFKTLDNGRGVVDADSLQKFYTKLSGIPTDQDFQLVIDRFAQPEEKWLSFSEFSDIFRAPTSRKDEFQQALTHNPQGCHEINGIKLQPEAIRLLAQILFLTLDLQHHLRKILSRFKKSEVEWLFTRINTDSESKGFINYQELKRFLSEDLKMNITMVDLMAVLKRLDKSKNGVVVKQQFLVC